MTVWDDEPICDAVRQRRKDQLLLTQLEAAQTAGVDRATWQRIERSGKARRRQLEDSTIAGIERALLWAPGSLAAIAKGGNPVETDEDGNIINPDDLAEDDRRLRRAVLMHRGMTADEKEVVLRVAGSYTKTGQRIEIQPVRPGVPAVCG